MLISFISDSSKLYLFEDMTTAISLICFSESPEVIEFNKWRGFGHISMDQKGTVPGVSWIKINGFTTPKCVSSLSGCFLDMLQPKNKNNLRDIKKINLDGSMMRFFLVSNEFFAAPRSCLPKLFLVYIQFTF